MGIYPCISEHAELGTQARQTLAEAKNAPDVIIHKNLSPRAVAAAFSRQRRRRRYRAMHGSTREGVGALPSPSPAIARGRKRALPTLSDLIALKEPGWI
jgi:hypothetical protein